MVMIEFPYQPVDKAPSILPDMVFLDIEPELYSSTMVIWCKNNITKYWCYCPNWNKLCYTFHFESEEDKTMFILKWI